MEAGRCCRGLFIFFNVIIAIIGGGSLGVGIWMVLDSSGFVFFTNTTNFDLATTGMVTLAGYIMIAGGGGTLLFALIGIIGACATLRWLIGVYLFLLALALIAEVVLVILGIIYKFDWEQKLTKKSIELIRTDYDAANDFSSALDGIQKEFECCGIVNGLDEYNDTLNWDKGDPNNNETAMVPSSCCKDTSNDCWYQATSTNSYIDTGCNDAIEAKLIQFYAIIIGIAAGLVVFQMMLLVIGGCVFSTKKGLQNEKYDMSRM